ncbi:advillin isoform X1 [Patella vulgata]|uniref:advillin isoform X1 n=2 Tax=Patella vulgata TaxID=6465 RepID=UPI00217FF3B9|nr:advillin isoform X1 [Patella vulgata]
MDTEETTNMANIDPAFKQVSRNRACFNVWRIEKMQVVPVPREFHGKFFRGDSYIILSIKEVKGALESHIHFWLGSETSQDEAGVAAYKSVELDDYLGGSPVQHREVEGAESRRFISYFSKGFVVVAGGVKSGFNHVEEVFKPKLLRVKGKTIPIVSEVEIGWEGMNEGDSFILDLGQTLFAWMGGKCRRSERLKAMEYSRSLRDTRKKANIIVIEDGEEEKLTGKSKELFESHLPIPDKRGKLKSVEEVGTDDVAERNAGAQIKLFSCHEEGGTLKLSEIKTGPLSHKDLHNDDSFIVDNGHAGIWVWIGKKASSKEKKEAMRNALGFVTKKEYPSKTPVTRVVENGEPVEFKCLFRDWPQPPPPGKVYSNNRIAKTVQTKFDAATLHSKPALAAETQMVDDGTGEVEVWRVNDFELVEVEKGHYGEFFGGDCYVIKYTYQVNNRPHYIIYYWLGAKSSADEQGTAALKAVEKDDELGGAAVQVRVVQNKEPPHFMAMFDGKMIVFSGGKGGWNGGQSNDGPGDKYMLQVRGTSKLNSKAVQVELRAASLNSNDVFVIFTKQAVYTWAGKGCTGDEREMAKLVASRSPRVLTMVFEGQEKDDFWNVLGGKEEYASEKRLTADDSTHPPRLYQLSNASGRFTCEEIPDFVQSDLICEDVMLLDCWDNIFVWVGDDANAQEKKEAERVALEYLKTDPSGRDEDTPIIRIKQGREPPSFTGFFGVWDREMWSKGKTFEEMKEELGSQDISVDIVKESIANGAPDFDEVQKYPLEKLQGKPEELPEGVDPSAREIHLKHEDFEKYFGMNFNDFNSKPIWKKTQLKKAVKLF